MLSNVFDYESYKDYEILAWFSKFDSDMIRNSFDQPLLSLPRDVVLERMRDVTNELGLSEDEVKDALLFVQTNRKNNFQHPLNLNFHKMIHCDFLGQVIPENASCFEFPDGSFYFIDNESIGFNDAEYNEFKEAEGLSSCYVIGVKSKYGNIYLQIPAHFSDYDEFFDEAGIIHPKISVKGSVRIYPANDFDSFYDKVYSRTEFYTTTGDVNTSKAVETLSCNYSDKDFGKILNMEEDLPYSKSNIYNFRNIYAFSNEQQKRALAFKGVRNYYSSFDEFDELWDKWKAEFMRGWNKYNG